MAKKGKGTGHYYRGDRRVDFTWTDKISEGLRKHHQEKKLRKVCERCGDEFDTSVSQAKYCSPKCKKKATYDDVSGVEKKAIVFGANLLMGKNKRKVLIEMIETALGKPCRYCLDTLSLENISIDHIRAYGSSKDRANTKKNKELRAEMDRRENLQVICKSCNGVKGDFDDAEFRALLGMDAKFPGLARKLKRRLTQSKLSWARRAERGQRLGQSAYR